MTQERRVFERLDPAQFQQGFQSWVSSLAELLGATVVSDWWQDSQKLL